MAADVESMMYTKEVPWHGLGTYVGDEPVLAEEAMRQARLDWRVQKSKAIAVLESPDAPWGTQVDAEGWYFTVRESDGAVFGCVSERYSVLQNSEAFDFMDAVAGPGRLVRYHTAGSLLGGKHVWLLAELQDLVCEPVPGDVTRPYLLLVNGHDGRMPVRALFTSVRVVCQNTMNMALKEARGGGVTLRHTGDISRKAQEAQKVLGLARASFEVYSQHAKYLASKSATDAILDGMLDSLFPLHSEDSGKSNTRVEAHRDEIARLAEEGAGVDLPGVLGSRWGLLNAVTEYTTHVKGTRTKNKDHAQSSRLRASWFGEGDRVNQSALKYLLEA